MRPQWPPFTSKPVADPQTQFSLSFREYSTQQCSGGIKLDIGHSEQKQGKYNSAYSIVVLAERKLTVLCLCCRLTVVTVSGSVRVDFRKNGFQAKLPVSSKTGQLTENGNLSYVWRLAKSIGQQVSNLTAVLDAILWRVGAADCEMWNGHRHGF
ncbi:hypothetical protein TIFTF001_034037 [Ficus carica]|uniref:Uncharacterized protein n=1 Tax=Ficus carica TaxID=3494 RepID=A0AA88E0E6_FICCA|nr:hypothetical protein TIFTF001_034037 [Ficus carica]